MDSTHSMLASWLRSREGVDAVRSTAGFGVVVMVVGLRDENTSRRTGGCTPCADSWGWGATIPIPVPVVEPVRVPRPVLTLQPCTARVAPPGRYGRVFVLSELGLPFELTVYITFPDKDRKVLEGLEWGDFGRLLVFYIRIQSLVPLERLSNRHGFDSPAPSVMRLIRVDWHTGGPGAE